MNKMLNNIYIIIVNYNGWKDTIECIHSLRRIYSDTINLVIVDNKSVDTSVSHIEKELDDHTKLLKSDENRGFSAGNNIGIRYALSQNAKYILLLNNDTLVEEDFITPLVQFASRHSDCGIISPRIYYNRDKDLIWYDGGTFHYHTCRAEHYRINTKISTAKGINESNFVSGCCMLIPAEVIKKVGLMDEDFFLYVEDTEYCLRVMKMGYKLFWDASHCIYHKVSVSTGKISGLSQYYEIRNRRLLAKKYLNFAQRISTIFYNIPFYTHKLVTGQYRLKYLVLAILDDYKKQYGKRLG